jgi:putative chitinase
MRLDYDTLRKCLPYAKPDNLKLYLDPLNETFEKFEINTPERISAFIAQIAHESGSFRYTEEIASGEQYEGRVDLGNIHPGDGMKYKGRGLIQITGYANYKAVSDALHYDFVSKPQDLEKPTAAAMSAGWFWKKHGLNELADGGQFTLITRRINGGLNGFEQRAKFWMRCKDVLIPPKK